MTGVRLNRRSDRSPDSSRVGQWSASVPGRPAGYEVGTGPAVLILVHLADEEFTTVDDSLGRHVEATASHPACRAWRGRTRRTAQSEHPRISGRLGRDGPTPAPRAPVALFYGPVRR